MYTSILITGLTPQYAILYPMFESLLVLGYYQCAIELVYSIIKL
jgi:hypothetical protein